MALSAGKRCTLGAHRNPKRKAWQIQVKSQLFSYNINMFVPWVTQQICRKPPLNPSIEQWQRGDRAMPEPVHHGKDCLQHACDSARCTKPSSLFYSFHAISSLIARLGKYMPSEREIRCSKWVNSYSQSCLHVCPELCWVLGWHRMGISRELRNQTKLGVWLLTSAKNLGREQIPQVPCNFKFQSIVPSTCSTAMSRMLWVVRKEEGNKTHIIFPMQLISVLTLYLEKHLETRHVDRYRNGYGLNMFSQEHLL